uniref:putative plastid-specific 30S ribosomal protein n=1 Tax=Phaeostrophion irregulare TaxID=243268 RepID=UPI002E765AA6|nr:putative plastid-specific 30S ribosomal protein [Phaeostrophion irregulare]WAM64369.1 putative plastid-specific 30S ribosomal protein [Phaeostrophion irregulare]
MNNLYILNKDNQYVFKISNKLNNYLFKVIWGKSYIGIAIDKTITGNITFPITTFFFWPTQNALGLLERELFLKPWITSEDGLEIIHDARKLIDYWGSNIEDIEGITKLIKESPVYNFELLANF